MTIACGWLSLLLATGSSAQVALQGCVQADAFFFSTEVSFLDSGPIPSDGNPIISDGDLLGRTAFGCLICARNAELLSAHGTSIDLGLDAVDVVVDGQDMIVLFSTELDSPPPGTFRAGDLLATNGAVIPNEVLLQKFSLGFDIGLDAVHAVGSPQSLIGFWTDAAQLARQEWLNEPQTLIDLLDTRDVDLWISTEGKAPSPSSPSLVDGDLLSARTGTVILGNGDILPISVPAGIPLRGVDFGLDGISASRSGEPSTIRFSTETPFPGPPEFAASDLLGIQLAWKARLDSFVSCFEPKTKALGLDALSTNVPEPRGFAGLSAGIFLVSALGRMRVRMRVG
jgi:hypothetical protein